MALHKFFAITALATMAATAMPAARALAPSPPPVEKPQLSAKHKRTHQGKPETGLYSASLVYFDQTNVTNGSVSIQAGQLIELLGTVNTSLWTQSSWNVSNPNAFSESLCPSPMTTPPTNGYPCGGTTAIPFPTPLTIFPTINFYFIIPGETETVTFTGYDQYGNALASASVTFVVDGPTGVNVVASGNQTINVLPPPVPIANISQTDPFVGDGSVQGNVYYDGIKWVASSSHIPSGGQYWWVQIILADHGQQLLNASGYQPVNYAPTAPELDTGYPYPFTSTTSGYTNDTAEDGPGETLLSKYGERTRYFHANMYLMWNAAPALVCSSQYGSNAATCAIPIPLGVNDWSVTYDAINTLLPGALLGNSSQYPIWLLGGCSKQSQSVWTPSNHNLPSAQLFPSWTGIPNYVN